MDGCLLRGHKFAHKDVLWTSHCRIAEEGLGQLDTQSAVLELPKPGSVGLELSRRARQLVVRVGPLRGVHPGYAIIRQVGPKAFPPGDSLWFPVHKGKARIPREDFSLPSVEP